jgi:hypothetical protein
MTASLAKLIRQTITLPMAQQFFRLLAPELCSLSKPERVNASVFIAPFVGEKEVSGFAQNLLKKCDMTREGAMVTCVSLSSLTLTKSVAPKVLFVAACLTLLTHDPLPAVIISRATETLGRKNPCEAIPVCLIDFVKEKTGLDLMAEPVYSLIVLLSIFAENFLLLKPFLGLASPDEEELLLVVGLALGEVSLEKAIKTEFKNWERVAAVTLLLLKIQGKKELVQFGLWLCENGKMDGICCLTSEVCAGIVKNVENSRFLGMLAKCFGKDVGQSGLEKVLCGVFGKESGAVELRKEEVEWVVKTLFT